MKKIFVILLLCCFTIAGVAEDQEIVIGHGKAKWNPTLSHELWLIDIIEKTGFECRRLDMVTINGFKDGLITRYAISCENELSYAYDFFDLMYWEEHLDWCVTGTIDGNIKEVCIDPKTGNITS